MDDKVTLKRVENILNNCEAIRFYFDGLRKAQQLDIIAQILITDARFNQAKQDKLIMHKLTDDVKIDTITGTTDIFTQTSEDGSGAYRHERFYK